MENSANEKLVVLRKKISEKQLAGRKNTIHTDCNYQNFPTKGFVRRN